MPAFAPDRLSPPIVLDGGLATRLVALGHDLSDELWSARLLHDDPAAIRGAHLDFLRAGARVVTTASYQASVDGFGRRGYPDPAGLIRRSVSLAREAIDLYTMESGYPGPLWTAASVGPYGAVLADGSEYRGDYGLSRAELVRFHRPRLELLAEAEPDVLALETVPDLREAEALLQAIDGLGRPAWLSFTVANGKTRAGQPLDEAFGLARGVDAVVAVGVNCCAPDEVAATVRTAVAASGKPGLAYPNSGEGWDAVARDWTGAPTPELPVRDWLAAGARLVGGCCRVTPAHITAIDSIVRRIDDN